MAVPRVALLVKQTSVLSFVVTNSFLCIRTKGDSVWGGGGGGRLEGGGGGHYNKLL
jgi:hypothetical protein